MRRTLIVVVGAMALLGLVDAVQVVRGDDWFLVALPVCVCATGLAGLVVGDSVEGRAVSRLPVLLVGALGVVLGVIAVATGDTPTSIFVVLAVLGAVLAVVGASMRFRRPAAARHE